MKSVAILGSGFGLYGYMPALALSGFQIILPKRYKIRFDARTELASFAPQVEWQPDEHAAIAAASAVVLSLPPEQQVTWLPICLKKKNISHLLLEKPLAPSPKESYDLLNQLKIANKKYRIGYLFRYTHWGNALLNQLENKNTAEITIQWYFMAHHYQNNLQTWKRSHSAGGGVLRFYGIHLLALLAELGYQKVSSSRISGKLADDYDSWEARFTGPKLPPCIIHIDICANQSLFRIAQTTSEINLSDPFQSEIQIDTADRRIQSLQKLCASLFSSDDTIPSYYSSTIKLWQQVENQLFHEEITYE